MTGTEEHIAGLGQQVADRHHIEIEPAPAEPSRGRSARGAEGGSQ